MSKKRNLNPYIKKLQDELTPEELYKAIEYFPDYASSYRKKPSHERKRLAEEIKFFRYPLPFNFEFYETLMRTLRQGYSDRDPNDPEWRAKINQGDYDTSGSNVTGFSMLGESGMGKTSTLKLILPLIPKKIIHHECNGEKFSQTQIVWLKIECPSTKSTKRLCRDFFEAVDKEVGTTYKKKHANSRLEDLLSDMPMVAAELALGVLIIDEIQRLKRATKQGAQEMLDFFVELSNKIGVPIVLVGTPDAKEVFENLKAMARRFEPMYLDNLAKDGDFERVLRKLWKFQYTNKETMISQDLIDVFWDETRGVLDTMIKLYHDVQMYVIGGGNETITPDIIRKVAEKTIPLTRSINQNGIAQDVQSKNTPIPVANQPIKPTGEENNYTKRDMLAHTFVVTLKYPLPKAQNFAATLIQKFPGFDISSLAMEGFNIHSQKSATKQNHPPSPPSRKKNKKKKEPDIDINSLPPDDLRRILKKGEKEGISAYDALKQNGAIKSITDLLED